jgi:homoaconitase/3-isopropylmalate dehydratase large subunit
MRARVPARGGKSSAASGSDGTPSNPATPLCSRRPALPVTNTLPRWRRFSSSATWARTLRSTIPPASCFSATTLPFDEVISEEKKKLGLLDLATQLKLKQQDFAAKQGIKLHGELRDRKGSEGICHSIVLESYALPGQLNIGSDSHTPHVGAIGCVAFGIGTTDVFNSWITKDVRVKVPESVKIIIRAGSMAT